MTDESSNANSSTVDQEKNSKNTVTKAHLAELLFNRIGLNKREAKELIECFFEEIKISLENGKDIKLSGFGNFILRNKSPRPGRNPKTGEKVNTPEKKTINFKMSKELFKKLNNENE